MSTTFGQMSGHAVTSWGPLTLEGVPMSMLPQQPSSAKTRLWSQHHKGPCDSCTAWRGAIQCIPCPLKASGSDHCIVWDDDGIWLGSVIGRRVSPPVLNWGNQPIDVSLLFVCCSIVNGVFLFFIEFHSVSTDSTVFCTINHTSERRLDHEECCDVLSSVKGRVSCSEEPFTFHCAGIESIE